MVQVQKALAASPTVRTADKGIVAGRKNGELRKRQHHTSKDIDAYLLIHRARRSSSVAEHPVSAVKAGQQGVKAVFLATIHVLQQQTAALVQQGEAGEVGGVLPRGLEDEPQLLSKGAASEEEDHDEGMGEADFRPVDGAIADGLEEDEGLFVSWIEEDLALDVILEGWLDGWLESTNAREHTCNALS